MTKLSYERNGKVYETESTALPATAIAYLLQYGFSQSLQDSIAGRAKAVEQELLNPDPKPEGWTAPDRAALDAAIASDLDGTLGKRLDAIVAGTVATRGPGTARDPAASIIRDFLVIYAKKTGKKLPKADSDEYAAMVAKVRKDKADYITAELERRAQLDIDIKF